MVSKTDTPIFILAGGLGTRISEETQLKPKPMIEIGELPILLHIMRWYYAFGFNDFVICAGYRSWEIKDYFLNWEYRTNHLQIDHRASVNNRPTAFGANAQQEQWRVTIIDTGLETMTGARLARAMDETAKKFSFENFGLTYGDGLGNIDLEREFKFHVKHGKVGTVLGVPPPSRFGELDVVGQDEVGGFLEKPESRSGLINGGFFFFKKAFRTYLTTRPDCVLERNPLSKLASDGQLHVFKHKGFWHPMDTLRDKNFLQGIWDRGDAPWRVEAALEQQVSKPAKGRAEKTTNLVGHA